MIASQGSMVGTQASGCSQFLLEQMLERVSSPAQLRSVGRKYAANVDDMASNNEAQVSQSFQTNVRLA